MSVSNHQPEYDEDELLDIEPELPPSGKDKKKTKKSTTKRKERKEEPQPDAEEEQEGGKEQAVEGEEEEPVVEPEPAKKQRKTFAEHKLKGDRLALMPNYRRKLEKNRARNKQKLGDEQHERKKLQAGTISRLESNYLQHANGLLLPYAVVRRVVVQESASIIDELQRINSGMELRLKARGKEPPATLTIKNSAQWHFSDNAVELVRAAVQAKLETVSEAASDMRRKTGRVTVMDTDITDALHFMETYHK